MVASAIARARAFLAARWARAAALRLPDAITLTRWAVLVLLLLLAVDQPEPTRLGVPAWSLVAFFMGYSLLMHVVGRHRPWVRLRLQPALDVAIAAALYLLDGSASGAMYTLVLLATLTAVTTLPRRGAAIAGIVAVGVVLLRVLLTYHPWSFPMIAHEAGQRILRLAVIILVGITLAQRLALQHLTTHQAQHQADREAELNRLRETFVAAVSHDLQTPLTALRAGLGLLEATAAPRMRDEEAQLLANARRNVDRLGLQINDLVTLNQLEAGQLDLTLAEVDPRELIAAVVATVHPLLTAREQQLTLDLAAPDGMMVSGDRRRLEQALLNLVVNAHKHTPAGTRIVMSSGVTDAGYVITVADNGPGIPPHELSHVFTRYYRGNRQTAGSGLGLAIAREMIERQGGRLSVDSTPGQGSAFSVLLPVTAATKGMDDDAARADR